MTVKQMLKQFQYRTLMILGDQELLQLDVGQLNKEKPGIHLLPHQIKQQYMCMMFPIEIQDLWFIPDYADRP